MPFVSWAKQLVRLDVDGHQGLHKSPDRKVTCLKCLKGASLQQIEFTWARTWLPNSPINQSWAAPRGAQPNERLLHVPAEDKQMCISMMTRKM